MDLGISTFMPAEVVDLYPLRHWAPKRTLAVEHRHRHGRSREARDQRQRDPLRAAAAE